MALLDDSPSDFDAVTLALSAEDANGFDLSATDLTTSKGSNEVLQLIKSGAGGSVAGVATAGALESIDRTQEERRESQDRAYAYLFSQTAVDFDLGLRQLAEEVAQKIAETVRAAEREFQELQRTTQTARDEALAALENDRIYQQQYERIVTTMDNADALGKEATAEILRIEEDIQGRLSNTITQMAVAVRDTDSETAAQSAETMRQFVEMSFGLVTLQVNHPDNGIPMRVAIYKDENSGGYYYMSPDGSARVDITDARRIRIIEAQSEAFPERKFGNKPGVGTRAEQYRTLQLEFAERIVEKGLTAQYINSFSELSRTMASYGKIGFLRTQIRNITQQVEDYRTNFNQKIEDGMTPGQIEEAIAQLERDIIDKRQEITERLADFETHMGNFQSGFNNILEQLNRHIEATRNSLEIDRQNGIADRDDQIRARFKDEWGPPSEFFVRGFLADLVASSDLKEAWRNDVVKHEGKLVYRDNDSLRLYTLSDDNTSRIFINDPVVEARLNRQAYGTPNADGSPSMDFKFFANETPYGESPFDTFRESFIANTSHERVQERIDEVESRGQQQYGGQSQPGSEETQGDPEASLRAGFELSAAHTWKPWEATVNFARSGFNAGIDMIGTFTNRAAQDDSVRIAGLSDTSPSTNIADDGEITPDPTPKNFV